MHAKDKILPGPTKK